MRQSCRAVQAFVLSNARPSIIRHDKASLFSSKTSQTTQSPSPPITNTNTKPKIQSNTGGLRRLPILKKSSELLHRAQQTTARLEPPTSAKYPNALKRTHKHGAERLTTLTQQLCVPLRDAVKGYRSNLRRLHPFEQVVVDLSARTEENTRGVVMEDVLTEVNEGRKELLEMSKDYIAKLKSCRSARDANDIMLEGEDAIATTFSHLITSPLTALSELQKSLRTTPSVRLECPAVVLVGAPNVGKSSIVRAISSGTPEVNNYPFTTRGMTLGHVEIFWGGEVGGEIVNVQTPHPKQNRPSPKITEEYLLVDRPKTNEPSSSNLGGSGSAYAYSQLCQIMDSPGILLRDTTEQRNAMEALTIASMQHLPTAVMYVLDLSGGAGDKCSSVSDQLMLRRQIRQRFPRRPWIDVVAKVDLGIVDGAEEELREVLISEGKKGDEYIRLSLHEDVGVEELKGDVMQMLGEVRLVLDAMSAVDERALPSNASA